MQMLGKRKKAGRKVTFIWMWKSGFWAKLGEIKASKTLFRGAASSRTTLIAQLPCEDSMACLTKWLSRLISTNARKPSTHWRTVPPPPKFLGETWQSVTGVGWIRGSGIQAWLGVSWACRISRKPGSFCSHPI